MLDIDKTILVVVDVQGKLAELMHDKERVFGNIAILIKSAKLLDMPIIFCQQVPAALGATIPQLAELFEGIDPVDKYTFSCCGDEGFTDKLREYRPDHVLLTGIETHICVYQTAMDLLEGGIDVNVIADAVSSRTHENKHVALTRLSAEGASISTTEMALFELLKDAKHPKFRDIARLIK
jgi:nicotinamidase-related amidase